MSKPERTPTGALSDLFLSIGVTTYPDYFQHIGLPNWPFPHQLNSLKGYTRSIRFADWSEPGVGKTFPAQLHAALMASLKNRVVFTMPPKLIEQFQQEFRDFFQGIDQHLRIDNLNGTGAQNDKKIAKWEAGEGWPDILLISYDRFRKYNNRAPMMVVPRTQWRMQDGSPFWKVVDGRITEDPVDPKAIPYTKDGRKVNNRGKAANPDQMRLVREGYNVYFFDEAHRLCNPSSQAFKSCVKMQHDYKDDLAMYLMSGTPVPTHLHNVYGLIKLVNPDAYANHAQFMRKHVITNPDSKFMQVLGYKGQDEVHSSLYKHAVRVQKRQVNKLPDPIISSIPVRLTGAHKRLYNQIVQDRFAILGEKVLAPDNDSALRQIALQVISCPDQFDETGSLQMDNELSGACDDLLDTINPANHKVILFAHYKRTVAFLADRYAEWNPAVMNGDTSKGWDEVTRFKEDPECRMFIVNWESGGEGLNLQVASHVIFYECPTSPRHAKQAIARVDRNGQHNVVNAYFFRVIGTLYDKNFKNLLKNERSNNTVVRDQKDLLHEYLGKR